jgi:hypothetical protein
VLAPVSLHAQQPELEQGQRYVTTMSAYLDLTEKLVDMSKRPETAVFQAIEGVVEIYQQRGEVSLAIEYLDDLLEDVDNPAVRNVLHLKLRELYQSTGQGSKALEQLKEMVKENVKRAD